jgi:hypothetical protein
MCFLFLFFFKGLNMPKDYLPTKDALLQDWLGNFLTIANANLAALGLVAGDLTGLTADKTSFDTQITAEATAKATQKATTQAKKTARAAAATKARIVVKKIQANPTVSNALKAQLQITVPGNNPSPSGPIAPTGLTVETLATGIKKLSWNRNNNPQGVIFLIETNSIPPTAWNLVASVTKSSYEFTIPVASCSTVALVKAQKGDINSVSPAMWW